MVNEKLNYKMNKKAMLPRTWVISILLFTSIFTLFFLAAQDMATQYGTDSVVLSAKYRDNYGKFDETIENEGGDLREVYTSFQSGDDSSWAVKIWEVTWGVIKGFIATVKVTFASLGILDDVTTSFSEDYGVPEGVSNVIFPLISAIIMVILLFVVVTALNRGNKI